MALQIETDKDERQRDKFGGIPPLFKAIGAAVTNDCDCTVCVAIRDILIREAKKNGNDIFLKKAGVP